VTDPVPSPAERREAAATRRRWVTLAEVVAVAGVVIAALTLWNSWSERRDAAAEKAAAQSTEARERGRVELTAAVEDGGRRLRLTDDKRDLTDLVVRFPAALGVAAQRPAEMAIDADWVAAPLLKLTDGGADERSGRLPVLVAVSYLDGDAPRVATGLYDLVWKTEGHVLRGRSLTLEGLRLRRRGGDQQALDAAWGREKP
jgi:hypothetical protein